MATEKSEILIDLTINTDKVLRDTVKLKGEVSNLVEQVEAEKLAFQKVEAAINEKEASLKALVAAEGKESKAVQEATNELRLLYTELNNNTLALTKKQAELKGAQSELRSYEKVLTQTTASEKEQTEALDEQIVTLDTLTARNEQLRLERRKININTQEGTEAITAINQEIDKNNDLIKQHSDKVKQDKINVGNYTDSILKAQEAFGDLKGSISGGIQKLIEIQSQGGGLKAFWGAFVGGVNSANKSLLRLLLNPVGLFLAAIVVAIQQYKAIISSSTELTNMFAKGWEVIQAVFSVVVSTARDLYMALFKLFTLDFSGALDTATKAVTGFADSMQGAVNAAIDLANINAQNEINERNRIIQLANLTAQLKKLEQVENDNTKSLKERQEASILAGEKRLELAEIEKQAADDALKAVSAQLEKNRAARKTNAEDDKAYVEALSKQIEATSNIEAKRYENGQKLREISNDNLQRELDALIDGFDVRKSLVEQELSDTTKSIDVRKKAFKDLQKDAVDNYQLEVDAINRFLVNNGKFTKAQIDSTELIKMNQLELSKFLTEKGLAADAVGARILDVYKERFMQLKDFSAQEKSFVQEQIQNQQKILNSQINNIQLDLQIFVETQKKKRAENKAITEQDLKTQIDSLENLSIAQRNAAVANYENKKELAIIAKEDLKALEKQLDLDLLKLESEYNAQSKALTDAKIAQDVEAEMFLFDLKKELAGQNIALQAQYAAEEVDIEAKKNKEIAQKTIADQTKLQKALLDIDKVAAQKKRAIKISELQDQLAANKEFLNNLKGAMKEHTKAYKAIAIAQATIDTISSAVSAYKSMAGLGPAGPYLGAIAAAAALFQGYQNIRKIVEVDPNGEDGASVGSAPTSSGGSVPTTNAPTAATVTSQSTGLAVGTDVNSSIIQSQQQVVTKNDIKGAFKEALQETPMQTAVVVDQVTYSQKSVTTNNNLSVL
jgi:hypothetical protein